MTTQEAKICSQMRYPVVAAGAVDTFGYWKPDKDTRYIIHAVREYYSKELKRFTSTLEVSIPESKASTLYTLSAENVKPAPEFEKLLDGNIKKIKAERTERAISSMIADGCTKSEINELVKNVWNKAVKKAPELTEKDKRDIKLIVDYLNTKAGTAFRASGKSTQRHIKARFREGYNTADFLKVIDKKCADWKEDEKMVKYLCPDTLFGSNFEKYLNQQTAQRKDRLKKDPSFDIDEIAKRAKFNDDYDI